MQADFTALLHRKADANGLSAFTTALANGATDEAVINAIFTSAEFLNQV